MRLELTKKIVRSNFFLTQKPPNSSEKKRKSPTLCSKKTFVSEWSNTWEATKPNSEVEKANGNASSGKTLQLHSTTISTCWLSSTSQSSDTQSWSSSLDESTIQWSLCFVLLRIQPIPHFIKELLSLMIWNLIWKYLIYHHVSSIKATRRYPRPFQSPIRRRYLFFYFSPGR